ncbi:MAG: hypothetical protein WBM07_00685 [Chitinivibrionales bacterium]
MRIIKNTTWLVLLFSISIFAAQPDIIRSDTSRNKPGFPAGLHLNAKGILIQAGVSDESVDTGGALPASAVEPSIADSNKSLREPTFFPKDNPKSNSIVQGNAGFNPVSNGSETLKTKEIFAGLGKYHKFMGVYGVLCGALGIIGGAMLIDKADDAPLAMSFITLGGFSIGFGLWEINVGEKLLNYGTAAK